MRTIACLGMATGLFGFVLVAHDGGWKQMRRVKRDEDEYKWTQEEMVEGEALERRALELPPLSQEEEEKEESNPNQQLN